MKANAVLGILFVSTAFVSFAQDPSDWGTRGLPQDRSDQGSPFSRSFSSERGRIRGNVLTLDGKPERNAHVQIHDFRTGRILGSVETDVSGGFSFDMLPYGSYEVSATDGTASDRQDVEVMGSFSTVSLRLNTSDPNATPSRNGLVSIVELKVPQGARDAYVRAQGAMMKNQPEKTSKYLQKALEICPTYAPALTMRGALLLDKGDLASAIDDFDKAIHADNTYALAHAGIAAALNRLNKFDDALRAAEQASTLSPNSWQPYFEMAKSYIGKADYQRALQQLTHAQGEMTHDYAPLHLLRASAFLALKNYRDATAELKFFLKNVPENDATASEVKDALAKINAFVSARAITPATEQPR
jgi:Flp pilus assembly protein TadD